MGVRGRSDIRIVGRATAGRRLSSSTREVSPVDYSEMDFPEIVLPSERDGMKELTKLLSERMLEITPEHTEMLREVGRLEKFPRKDAFSNVDAENNRRLEFLQRLKLLTFGSEEVLVKNEDYSYERREIEEEIFESEDQLDEELAMARDQDEEEDVYAYYRDRISQLERELQLLPRQVPQVENYYEPSKLGREFLSYAENFGAIDQEILSPVYGKPGDAHPVESSYDGSLRVRGENFQLHTLRFGAGASQSARLLMRERKLGTELPPDRRELDRARASLDDFSSKRAALELYAPVLYGGSSVVLMSGAGKLISVPRGLFMRCPVRNRSFFVSDGESLGLLDAKNELDAFAPGVVRDGEVHRGVFDFLLRLG